MSGAVRVVRAAAWRYFSSITSYIFGFAYWTLACKLVGPSVMGYYAAITAIVGIIGVLTSLNIGIGVLRHAGEAYGKGDIEQCSRYFSTAFTYRLLTAALAAGFLCLLGLLGVSICGYRPEHFILASMLCIPALLGEVAFSLLSSTLMLKYLFYASLIGNIARLSILVVLVALGLHLLAVVCSYLIYTSIVVSYSIAALVTRIGVRLRLRLSISELRKLVDVGIVTWIPGVLLILLNKLGLMFLFSVKGAFETGVYYVAMTLATLLLGLVGNVQGLMLPYLAGLEQDRERQMWHAHRLSLVIAVPLVASVVPFSDRLLALLRPEYARGWVVLALVVLNGLLALNNQPIGNLLYVYNKHRVILKIALTCVLLRALLYAYLVPMLGGVGLALTDLVATSTSLTIYYVYVNRRYVHYHVEKDVLVRILAAGIATLSVALALRALVDSLLLALPGLIIGYLLTMRWRLLSRGDLSFLGKALLPYKIRQRISPIVIRILDIVYG